MFFFVTAGLQDKRAPFEPRGGPEMGKDKHQAGQMGLNLPPLWYTRRELAGGLYLPDKPTAGTWA